ncbi:MAG: hypothetical protein MI784_06980, partial [Cytophagales bacterium]|nr:hypothetical protein [Cytophagales bacterium]
GYTHIEGVLILKGDITDLSPINHLKVFNEFGVACDRLTSLEGLDSLQIIHSYFFVSDCDSLKDFSGLENLSKVSNVQIDDLKSLTSLDGLSPKKISALKLTNAPELSDISAINSVQSIERELYMTGVGQVDPCVIKDLLLRHIPKKQTYIKGKDADGNGIVYTHNDILGGACD